MRMSWFLHHDPRSLHQLLYLTVCGKETLSVARTPCFRKELRICINLKLNCAINIEFERLFFGVHDLMTLLAHISSMLSSLILFV